MQDLKMHEELYKILNLIQQIFDAKKIPFWLEYGTLLGAVRNGKLIEWDKDVDIGIWYTDIGKVLRTESWFADKHYYLRQDKNGNFTIGKRMEHGIVRLVDIFLFKKVDDWIIRVYRKGNYKGERRFKEFDVRAKDWHYSQFKYIYLNGKPFIVPLFAEKSLDFTYGKSWKTPIKKTKYKRKFGEDGRTHHLKRCDLE